MKTFLRLQTGRPAFTFSPERGKLRLTAISPTGGMQLPFRRDVIGQDAGANAGIAAGGFIPNRILQSATTPPNEVQATMDRVNASYVALDGDVRANAPNIQNKAFLDGWSSDKAAWDTFYGANRSLITIAATGSQTVLSQTEKFRLRLVGWNAAFESETGKKALVPPTGTEPKPEVSSGAPPWWVISIGTLAVVGVVGYAGYQGYKAIEEARLLKKSRDEKKVPGILASPRLAPKTQERMVKALSHRNVPAHDPAPGFAGIHKGHDPGDSRDDYDE